MKQFLTTLLILAGSFSAAYADEPAIPQSFDSRTLTHTCGVDNYHAISLWSSGEGYRYLEAKVLRSSWTSVFHFMNCNSSRTRCEAMNNKGVELYTVEYHKYEASIFDSKGKLLTVCSAYWPMPISGGGNSDLGSP